MHVAVTGASSGIGEAIARAFARAGADVTLVARRAEVLERVAAELGGRTFVAPVDLTDFARAADWIARAEAALGPIDVLVSNAGFLELGPVASFDPETAERMFAVNALAPMRMIRAVLPGMLARRAGVVVNVTSMAAVVPMPDWIHQSASKSASAVFSETLRVELRGTGVHVMTVYPGMTDTPMTQGGLDAYGRTGLVKRIPLGRADQLAERLVRAVARRRARMFYPRFYAITRLFPGLSRAFAATFAPRLSS